MSNTLKKCPACGKFFTCTSSEDCWCEKLQIHKKDFIRITEKYNNCICPDCMDAYVEK